MEQKEAFINKEKVSVAVNSVAKLNPCELIQVLQLLSSEFSADAAELQQAWADKEAGKIWEIAAAGLAKTSNEVHEFWKKS